MERLPTPGGFPYISKKYCGFFKVLMGVSGGWETRSMAQGQRVAQTGDEKPFYV